MSEKLQDLRERLSHPQTITAIIGAVGIIANALGYKLDTGYANDVAMAIFTVLVALGVLNNPSSNGAYVPLVTKSKVPQLLELGKRVQTDATTDAKVVEKRPATFSNAKDAVPTESDLEKETQNYKDEPIVNYTMKDKE